MTRCMPIILLRKVTRNSWLVSDDCAADKDVFQGWIRKILLHVMFSPDCLWLSRMDWVLID